MKFYTCTYYRKPQDEEYSHGEIIESIKCWVYFLKIVDFSFFSVHEHCVDKHNIYIYPYTSVMF